MSESSLASIQTWLTAPMKQDVSEAIERLEVIELRDAEHGDFLQTGPVQTRTVREMRRFLFSSP